MMTACTHVDRVRGVRGGEATAPREASAPAEVVSASGSLSLPLPAGSLVELDTREPERVRVLTPTATVLTAQHTSDVARTGAVDPSVARARAQQTTATALGRHRITVGAGMIVLGVVVGFALPGAMRWPLAGAMIGGAGLLLVLAPQMPAWIVATMLGVAIGLPVAWYLARRPRDNVSTKS